PGGSPRTFGHFGGAGTFLWVDPDAAVACIVLTDREFGDWAPPLWSAVSAEVLAAYGAAPRSCRRRGARPVGSERGREQVGGAGGHGGGQPRRLGQDLLGVELRRHQLLPEEVGV